MKNMIAKQKSWYKEIWTLDIKNQSWTEETVKQVDFLIKTLHLQGNEKILDLACGFGRHSLEFARRGYTVVGVDITKAYVEDAQQVARREQLPAQFFCMDVRDVSFVEAFDVVLNLGDGAIGYLENEDENLKIFDVIARALRPRGRHVMDIMNADYADSHFPCNLWDAGENGLTLSRFEWNPETNIMLYGQNDFAYGHPLGVPWFGAGDPIRLYHRAEVHQIMAQRNMCVKQVYGKFDGTPGSVNEIQMIVVSEKQP